MLPSGRACFVCEVPNEASTDLNGLTDCSRCGPSVKLDQKHAQRVLEHMGAHILYDATMNTSEEYCGLCLRPSPMCQIYVTKGRGTGGRLSVDWSRSTCPNLVRFSYKSAAQSSESSPCSNVPVVCSLCLPGSPAVWTYSIQSHYRIRHRIPSVDNFPTRVELSQSEKDGMKRVWSTRFNQRRSYFSKKKRKTRLAISEAHRSRLLIRSVGSHSSRLSFNSTSIALQKLFTPTLTTPLMKTQAANTANMRAQLGTKMGTTRIPAGITQVSPSILSGVRTDNSSMAVMTPPRPPRASSFHLDPSGPAASTPSFAGTQTQVPGASATPRVSMAETSNTVTVSPHSPVIPFTSITDAAPFTSPAPVGPVPDVPRTSMTPELAQAQAPTTSAVSSAGPSGEGTRRHRIRKAYVLELNACTCGVTITDKEIEELKGVMKCCTPGCETVWVSVEFTLCMFLLTYPL